MGSHSLSCQGLADLAAGAHTESLSPSQGRERVQGRGLAPGGRGPAPGGRGPAPSMGFPTPVPRLAGPHGITQGPSCHLHFTKVKGRVQSQRQVAGPRCISCCAPHPQAGDALGQGLSRPLGLPHPTPHTQLGMCRGLCPALCVGAPWAAAGGPGQDGTHPLTWGVLEQPAHSSRAADRALFK